MDKAALNADTNGAGNLQAVAATNQIQTPPRRIQRGFAESFAQIVAVLMRDRNFRNLPLADLEWLVLPPVMVGQFGLAHVSQTRGKGAKSLDKQEGTILVPVAVALWARVSANVDKVLSENLDKQPRLQPSDWVSGKNIWLIAVAGDQRAIPKFLEQLLEKDFKGQRVKVRSRASDGKMTVKTLGRPAT